MPAEINDDLMVLHAPTALYGAKVSQKAIVTVAHPSQLAVFEHAPRMHEEYYGTVPLGSARMVSAAIGACGTPSSAPLEPH
jgi:hypothetical protein